MENQQDKHTISMQFNVKDPVPGAPRHELRTVADIMNVLTPENVDRFLEDFATGTKGAVLMIDALRAIVEATDEPFDVVQMGADVFTWTDDRPRVLPPTRAKTWRELRDLLNHTPDAELDKPLEWWGDEVGGEGCVSALTQDMYRSDYGLVEESEWDESEEEKPEFPSVRKGHLIFAAE